MTIINIIDNNKNILFNTDILGDVEMTYNEYNYVSYITSYLDDSLVIISTDHSGIITELTKILRKLR